MDFTDIMIIILILVMILGSLFEVGLLYYGYTHADKVQCNLLWCTFTKTNVLTSEDSSSNYTSISSSDRTCSKNGKPINCSEIDKELSKVGFQYAGS